MDDEQYRALIEQAPTLIWRAGLDGGRDYFNATWLRFTGRTLEQERGAGWLDGVHPEDRSATLAALRGHLERRRFFELEYRLRRFDGSYRSVLDRAAPLSEGGGVFAGFSGSCVDVEERRAAAADDFFEMSLDNLAVAGLDGFLKRVNPSWTRTLGWTAEELKSRPSVEFVHPEDRQPTLAGRARLGAGTEMGPLVNRYLHKDGGHRWFEWRSVAHLDRGLVYAAARDITDQKKAEESLRQAKEMQEKLQRQLIFADRMASVGTLAAGVAHEINNPLTYVAANVNLIIEGLEALAPAEQFVELREMAVEAREGAERIRKIVRGLKTFSRAEEERRAVIELRPVLELAIDMTFNEIHQRARLVKDYGPVPPVEADDARLGQVFINLLINAAQAIPEGDTAGNEIRVLTSTDAAGRALIEVRDTGPGIPDAIAGRIFDPFFTTKPVGIGTGLGLSICHTIVTGLGGEISAARRPGGGTSFFVALPAARTAAPDAPGPAAPPKTRDAGAKVLLVDDEAAIGVVLHRLLRAHEVTAVTSAKEALDLLESGRRYDVVLSDLMMPEMSGMELHAELARRFPEVAQRMVFLSGGAFTPAAKAFLDRVPNERIEKPFEAQRIRSLIERLVRERNAASGG